MKNGRYAEIESRERTAIVEVAFERNDAVASKPAHVVAVAREADEPHAIVQQVGDAQRHVAATHEQQPLHHDPAD